MAEQMYMSYLTSFPLYEQILPAEQGHTIEFLAHGMLINLE